METINTCKICATPLKSKRAKICKDKICASKWKMVRNANLKPITKTCKLCNTSFDTVDRRNNFCSTECKVTNTHNTKLQKYGKKSTTCSRERRSELSLQFFENNEHPRRVKFLKKQKCDSMEEFANKLAGYCKDNNLAPNSPKCLEHFGISTFMTGRILREFDLENVLNNSNRNSTQELEIQDFIRSIGKTNFKTNQRYKFVKNRELDIYLPEDAFAIEFHGLAHHSERPVWQDKKIDKIKYQHRDKYLGCKTQNIRLMQIFEDEWRDRREIVESMIKNRLNLTTHKIAARKCDVIVVPGTQRTSFFNNNHIDGDAKATIAYGLTYNGELVACISLRHTWNSKYGKRIVEIARFASKLDYNIVGGFSKLMKPAKFWTQENGFNKMLTYADLRFGDGDVYKNYGFKHLGSTSVGKYYEKNGIRESRYKHRKNNDPEFIAKYGNTEREQQNALGWFAIYDAGNNIFLLKIE